MTGGAGFIGSAVCRLFVAELGVTVLNVDKLTYAANLASLQPIENHPGYNFHRADICDRPAIARLLGEFMPDAVLHLAAELHVDRSIDGPGEFIRTNIDGTYSMLEAVARLLAQAVAGAGRGVPLPSRLDRRGVRRAGRTRQVPRDQPLQAEFALRGVKGGLRPSGARLARDLRAAGRC